MPERVPSLLRAGRASVFRPRPPPAGRPRSARGRAGLRSEEAAGDSRKGGFLPRCRCSRAHPPDGRSSSERTGMRPLSRNLQVPRGSSFFLAPLSAARRRRGCGHWSTTGLARAPISADGPRRSPNQAATSLCIAVFHPPLVSRLPRLKPGMVPPRLGRPREPTLLKLR